MSGLTILGWVLFVLGGLIAFWGGTLFPVDLFNSDFMSFVVGGCALGLIGCLLINELPNSIKIGMSILVGVLSCIYVMGFNDLDFILKIMSCVPIAGFFIWLIFKLI